MTNKLSNVERDALDKTCSNLRKVKLGTKVGEIEDFINIDSLKTDANDVRNAINELYELIKENSAQNVQVRNGYFTLWANSDGDLYCCSNSEDYPPTFTHDEETGNLYVNFATKDDDYGAEFKVANFIPVKKLDDYYKKTETYSQNEVNTKLNGKADTNHNHDTTYSKLTHNHDDRYYTENEIDTKLNGKADSTHNHDTVYSKLTHNHDSEYSKTTHNHDTVYSKLNHNHDDIYSKLSHTHDDRYYTETEIDSKIAQLNSDVEVDLESYVKKTDIDSSLSSTSTNPVQNKAINTALSDKASSSHTHPLIDINNVKYYGGKFVNNNGFYRAINFNGYFILSLFDVNLKSGQTILSLSIFQEKKTSRTFEVLLSTGEVGFLKYDGANEELVSQSTGKINGATIMWVLE